MNPLPPDFARRLAELIEPGQEAGTAKIIEAAVRLDDERLGVFLELLADRVRSSSALLREDEMRQLLLASKPGGRPGAA